MATGSPNKVNNFVKVFDPNQQVYRPIYELPDATDQIYGGVLLSDAVNGTANAATGVTAATPAAVKSVKDTADNKLDKTATTAQTVAGPVTFSTQVVGSKGFKGSLTGNASSATKLATSRTVTVAVTGEGGDTAATSGSTSFNGTADVTINVPKIPASAIKGIIDLSHIPQGAMDKLVKVDNAAKRLALTTASVQTGDSVLQLDTGAMYIVIDDTKLNSEEGYQIYKAGTALEAEHATKADSATSADSATKATQDSAGQQIDTTYIKNLSVSGKTVTYTKGDGTTGTLTTQDTTYSNMKGATSSAAGSAGLVPAPAKGKNTSFLRGDGNWVVPTNTTYKAFTGATSSAAGAAGLVPAPAKGTTTYYLKSDGTWAVAPLTGVKGDAETSYRTGNVNITPANIGALALTGGTVTGETTFSDEVTLNNGATFGTSGSFLPATTATVNLGSSSLTFGTIYATTFSGEATSVSDGAVTNAKIADSAVTTAKIAAGNVTGATIAAKTVAEGNLADSAVTTAKLAADSVTLAKLGSDVGTVQVGSATPTDSNVLVWIKTS